MLLIPGIIIKDGKAVYVKDVKSGDTDVISTEPAEVAKTWVENGAMRVHVVDFDGIKTGKASNAAIINEITEAVGDVPVQIRGGIRDEETVQSYLEAGIEYVVIGTRAVSAPHFVQDICLEYPGHIMVGLDIKEDKVAAEGWSKLSNQDIGKLAENFQRDGVEGIVYTEIGAGNAATSLNEDTVEKLGSNINIPIYVTDSVKNISDVEMLCKSNNDNLAGAIIDYSVKVNEFDLAEANRIVAQVSA